MFQQYGRILPLLYLIVNDIFHSTISKNDLLELNWYMDQFFDNLRLIDRKAFFSLNDFAMQSHFWRDFFYFFAQYGIVLIAIGVIYLVIRVRINAVFTAVLSSIISTFVSFIIYLLWQRPRPFITYAGSVDRLIARTTVVSFPSAHTYLSFAIAITVLLYGHKKLGLAMVVLALMTALSRVAIGVHYPSDVIGGAIIGLLSGILAYWWMESFEHFWQENSAVNE